MSPFKFIEIIFPGLFSIYCSMKYWLTISSALLKMLIRLRLIIADLALFYVEKSLKSERTLYPKLEVHLFSSFIHSLPKEYGLSHRMWVLCCPTTRSFFPQTSRSPLEGKILK